MRPGPLIPAEFVQRENRFVCRVLLSSREERAVLRSTGRLAELLVKGAQVYLRPKEGGRYSYELFLVRTDETFVCVNAQITPRLLVEYSERTGVPWQLRSVRHEFRVGRSRFDLLINGELLVEVKSVTLAVDGTALFPDAPTLRGRRHVAELMELSGSYRPAVVFIVQREDAQRFAPNRERDPAFAETLERFHRAGYTVRAFACRVTPEEVSVHRELPVILSEEQEKPLTRRLSHEAEDHRA